MSQKNRDLVDLCQLFYLATISSDKFRLKERVPITSVLVCLFKFFVSLLALFHRNFSNVCVKNNNNDAECISTIIISLHCTLVIWVTRPLNG